MVSANVVAAVITLLPAMGMLWAYLGRYEGYFAQNRLFFALVVGFFGGIVVRFVELLAFPFESTVMREATGTFFSFAYTAVGYAMLASFAFTVVLGFKNFRMRKDTAYYGASLGLGFGAMWTMQVVTGVLVDFTQPALRIDAAAWFVYVQLALAATGLVLSHGAAAVWVGRNATEGTLWRGAMVGTLWLTPAMGLYWILFTGYSQGLVVAGAILAYGILAMAVTQRKVLAKVVPPEVRDQLLKERRREQRKGNRDS